MDIKTFLNEGKNHFLPNLSIDHVIVGYENDQLKCLLLKLGPKWVLPGGFIKLQESVEIASKRILMESTNLENPHSNFLDVFGKEDRQFSKQWRQLLNNFGIKWQDDFWINARFVTLAYYSLVNIKAVKPLVGKGFEQIVWFNMEELPKTWMDHGKIIKNARERLKEDIKKEQISHKLLPDKFTMPELHQLHQTILGENLERSRFQKKMLSTGLFERLPKKLKETPGRNPFQYKVKT